MNIITSMVELLDGMTASDFDLLRTGVAITLVSLAVVITVAATAILQRRSI